jgi:hypothetical protein
MFLVWALNYQPGLSVRNWTHLLVPVEAFIYVRLLYAAHSDCQAQNQILLSHGGGHPLGKAFEVTP